MYFPWIPKNNQVITVEHRQRSSLIIWLLYFHFIFSVLWILIRIDFSRLDLDLDLHWECGSRREKKIPQKLKKVMKFHVLKCWMFFSATFSFSFEVLYVGLEIKNNCNF